MNFAEYLKSFSEDNTPVGDLARDFIASKNKAKTYTGIVKNLNKYNACDLAREILHEVNKSYLKTFKGE